MCIYRWMKHRQVYKTPVYTQVYIQVYETQEGWLVWGSQGWDEQLCRTRAHSPVRAKGKCSRSPNSASCSTAGPWPATGARGFWREIPAGLDTNCALCRRWRTTAGLHRHRHHHGRTSRTAGSPGARGATRWHSGLGCRAGTWARWAKPFWWRVGACGGGRSSLLQGQEWGGWQGVTGFFMVADCFNLGKGLIKSCL